MPLFEITNHKLTAVTMTNFGLEKELQALIEKNLEAVFNCRFVAREFSTGQTHAGRIDTLALSEENNPVIIEYKKVESSELINQSLFYLNWIFDHKGDYEIAVQKHLSGDVKVDWSDVRVICIAPNFRKYDLHAVQVIGANIELWSYRLYDNSSLYLEQVYGKNNSVSSIPAGSDTNGKNPVMVAAGKKAAQTRATGSYTFEEHLAGKPEKIQALAIQIQEYITSLDPAMMENPKKFYVGYKTSQNIVCMELKNQKIILFLKLNPETIGELPKIARDVRHIGHYGTGDLEITIRNETDFETAKLYIEMAYKKIGG
jgi:predicted transport protein